MQPNIAGLLSYLIGFISGIFFLVAEPYKRDHFVRFHAFQSIFVSVAWWGAPLWSETQEGQVDGLGHYSVQLGITRPDGVPATLFTTGEARWLGVQIAAQAEQPRVLLVGVPYAMKAGDAATLGGLPPSAFLSAAPANGNAGAGTGAVSPAASAPPPSGAVTGTVRGALNLLATGTATGGRTRNRLQASK